MDGHEDGFFVGPTVIDHVTTDMDVYREEIFGPVLSVLRVETVEEAIALINANPYGNGTAIFTSSGDAARRFQRGVHVGMIGINVPDPGADGLLLLRRLEGLAVRRQARARPRRRVVLHPRQGRHLALARAAPRRRAPAITSRPPPEASAERSAFRKGSNMIRQRRQVVAGCRGVPRCWHSACSSANSVNGQHNKAGGGTGGYKYKIAVVTHGGAGDSFWSIVKAGAVQAGKDMGDKVTYQSSGDPTSSRS